MAAIDGPFLGALLVQGIGVGTGWRAVFLVNVPVGATALAAAVPLLPESRAKANTVDWVGAALVTIGLSLLVLPHIEGRVLGWPL